MKHRNPMEVATPAIGKPFQDELGICGQCRTKKRFSPDIESGWTAIDIDSRRIYFCPECFARLRRDKKKRQA